jgi:hypothetical protein
VGFLSVNPWFGQKAQACLYALWNPHLFAPLSDTGPGLSVQGGLHSHGAHGIQL